MGENEQIQRQEAPVSLREALERGFERTEGMTDAQLEAENAGIPAADAQAEQIPAQNAEATPEAAQQAPEAAPMAAGYPPAQEAAPALQPQQPASDTAQLMQMMMAQMQQLQAQNAQLQQQIQAQQGTMQEQSQAAENAMDAAMTQPTINVQMPDFNAWQYEDDATREQHIRDWQESLIQSTRDATTAQIMAQFGPMMQDFEEKRRVAAAAAAKSALYDDPRFSDFRGRDAQIEKIIAADPAFADMDANRRYLYGGLMARGLDYNPTPTAEQIVEMAKANPDALRMLDAERARTIADRNGQIPTIMPSSGMATANAIPDDSPKTTDELHQRVAALLRR